MYTVIRRRFCCHVAALTLAGGLLLASGCDAPPLSSSRWSPGQSSDPLAAFLAAEGESATSASSAPSQSGATDDAAASSASMAQRLHQALDQSPAVEAGDAGPRVEWLDAPPSQAGEGPREGSNSSSQVQPYPAANPGERMARAGGADEPDPLQAFLTASRGEAFGGDPVQGDRPEPPGSSARPAAQPATPNLAALDRSTLIDLLVHRIRQGEQNPRSKAVALAALGAVSEGLALAESDLEPLSYDDRVFFRNLRSVMAELARHAAEEDAPLSDQDLLALVEQLEGERPLTIQDARLCRRVSGYGVYEPFETYTFLAGRQHPMIVYVEVDQFQTVEASSGDYEVKLAQEVVLFNESDGLKVWSHPQAEIVDRSHNRRRDFFLVKLIRLPERLSVGKYLLKVRVTDLHGNSMDETSIPLQIVADPALVGEN